jgi:cysteine sulfinate desulfinase/cysteine desulfurase-like protein
VRVEALQSGGGQERGMRSGTVPTPLVVGLGAACEVAQQEMEVCGEQFPFTTSSPVLGLQVSGVSAYLSQISIGKGISPFRCCLLL